MFKGKSLTEYTNLFSPNGFKENADTTFNYFMNDTYLYKMESYCLMCKKYTKNLNPRVSSTNNGKLMISKCTRCGSRKSKSINKQEAKGLLSNAGIKIPLIKIPVLGDILF